MTRLIQIRKGSVRRVALVAQPRLQLLKGLDSIVALARKALESNLPLSSTIQKNTAEEWLDYDPIYLGKSEWRILPAVDHPEEPSRCLVSGTGLTHMGSAKNRQAMHEAKDSQITDSMKMFRSGVEGGKPAPGKIGSAPEWFYKGNGAILRAHGEPLVVPGFAGDGGEEAEVAGVYYIAPDGQPCRIGMTVGNEFSDHKFEKTNYLNLAGSKIRTCSIGPELVIDPKFNSVTGRVSIERAGREIWSKDICTGEKEMSHSLRNLEHHHFKFETHRRPGDVHVHFFGAHSLSFGDGVELSDGDLISISFEGFGRALRNPVTVDPRREELIAVRVI